MMYKTVINMTFETEILSHNNEIKITKISDVIIELSLNYES